MNKYIELLKSNFTLITLIFYVLGYAYLGTYYFQFDILIVNYLNLLDIFFTTVNWFLVLLFVYVLIQFGLYFIGLIMLELIFNLTFEKKILNRLKKNSRVERYIEYRKNKYHSDNSKGITFFLLIITMFIVVYFENGTPYIITLFAPFFVIKLYHIIPKELKIQQTRKNHFFLVMLTFVLTICFIYWGAVDGTNSKESLGGKQLQFREANVLYNTKSDSLNYIGETSSYIFLYQTKNRETLIFNKSEITNFKTKDLSQTKSEKIAQQKEIEEKINKLFD